MHEILAATIARMGMDDPEECGADTQLLDIVEAISTHFYEHHDAVMRWPWRLFCVKWRRLMVQVTRRQVEREERDREMAHKRSEREERLALEHAHRQQWGT